MREPTPEQQAVLNLPEPRVRVVRAAPGSGKTWLVAELIRQEVARWNTPMSGIAALSFTRVGATEIKKAVGYQLDHPNFIGTIDAFLFRYVLRPFLTTCYPDYFPSPPRLIPEEWGAQQWQGKRLRGLITTKSGINTFGCVFLGEEDRRPTVWHRWKYQPLEQVQGTDLENVRTAKLKIWKQLGWVTHSDAAMWASKVLSHKRYGPVIVEELVRRFPLIVLDEAQDTGYFLGRAVLALLSSGAVRAMVVGDPDQAIFEFNGARPELFREFQSIRNAHTQQLARSLRCPPAIAKVASYLKDTGGTIEPAEENGARAILIRGNDMTSEVPQLVAAAAKSRPPATVKVVARANSTVDILRCQTVERLPKLGCPPITHMGRAIQALRQERQELALASAKAAMELALLGEEGASDLELKAQCLDPTEWKRLAVRCLLSANELPSSGNLYDWQAEIGTCLDEELTRFCAATHRLRKPCKLKPKKNAGWDTSASIFFPTREAEGQTTGCVSATTVHAVKGETHGCTILVVKDESSGARMPSNLWWSSSPNDREERRITYVAMTRTKGDLLVWMGSKSYDDLVVRRQDFVKSFENLELTEALSALEGQLERSRSAVNEH
jgi:DNA helicase II / ATP-dependent DNA helicase PcrA